jgi:hypothetical protein
VPLKSHLHRLGESGWDIVQSARSMVRSVDGIRAGKYDARQVEIISARPEIGDRRRDAVALMTAGCLRVRARSAVGARKSAEMSMPALPALSFALFPCR